MAGYWSLHPYHRLSVSELVEEWVGWQPLVELAEFTPWLRERGFIATLFLTGGRVSEVLKLKPSNFEVRTREGLIIVRGMPLLKRYRKIMETQTPDGKKRWITQRVEKTRKPFPILLKEPLVPYMLQWMEETPEEGYMFASPYKPGKPLSRFWAYQFIRRLDQALPAKLRQKLGLEKPFVRDGKVVEDRLHLWLHWFRSQRASQLVADYGFELHDLIDWFSWEHLETALTYSRKGWRGLASKMMIGGEKYATTPG